MALGTEAFAHRSENSSSGSWVTHGDRRDLASKSFLTSTNELWPARTVHIHTHTHENILKE